MHLTDAASILYRIEPIKNNILKELEGIVASERTLC